ncbi:MAG: SDR family NAD(P)-dependent oxidoreductase, partial [Sedimentitalea sp.]
MTNTLFSFGHGFSARALSPILLAEGWHITGTTRSDEKSEAIR